MPNYTEIFSESTETQSLSIDSTGYTARGQVCKNSSSQLFGHHINKVSFKLYQSGIPGSQQIQFIVQDSSGVIQAQTNTTADQLPTSLNWHDVLFPHNDYTMQADDRVYVQHTGSVGTLYLGWSNDSGTDGSDTQRGFLDGSSWTDANTGDHTLKIYEADVVEEPPEPTFTDAPLIEHILFLNTVVPR